MSTVVQDLRYSLRTLRKSPGFSAAAVGILALGIGANTALFSVVDAALLRPLPFPEPGRMMRLEEVPGHDDVVILSQALWQSRFGSDPQMCGATAS